MAMLAIIVAGIFEVGFAICLKLSDGFSKPLPTVGFLVFAGISLSLLTWALKDLPVGTAYAVWTGVGAVGTAIVGMTFLHDPVTGPRFVGIGLIVAGVVVLNVFSSSAAHG
jgi:quaternary ammonium compound-resistance protein SugE